MSIKKGLAIFTVIIFLIMSWVVMQRSPIEKEIEYYEGRGYEVVKISVLDFYDALPDVPSDLELIEVEVGRELLRERAAEAAE